MTSHSNRPVDIMDHMTNSPQWPELRRLASLQGHLITGPQCAAAGVDAAVIAAAVDDGTLWAVRPTVWVFTSEDKHLFEDWLADWLMLDPVRDPTERLRRPVAVMTGEAAAMVRELGTVTAYRSTFLGQVGKDGVVGDRVHLEPASPSALEGDWTIVDGMPVATPSRILRDLAADGIDGSHLGTVIDDIAFTGQMTLDEIGDVLDPYLQRWDYTRGMTTRDALETLIDASTGPAAV